MDLTERIDQPELMDTIRVPPLEMKKTLSCLGLMNRYFGGSTAILKYLSDWSVKWNRKQTIEILDVGTGGADIPIDVVRWARKKGFKVHVAGIDTVLEVVNIARENTKDFPEISIEQQDVFELIRKENGNFHYDYVTASLFLHHIPPTQSVQVLITLDRLARRGIIISDLHRTLLSYSAVSLLSYLIGNKIVRHDGPLSVRRAFTIPELNDLARAAGLPYLQASIEPWFRTSLSGEKFFPTQDLVPLPFRGGARGGVEVEENFLFEKVVVPVRPHPGPPPSGEGTNFLGITPKEIGGDYFL